jgi:hypothetical protein
MNMIIYDKKRLEFQRYDPNGQMDEYNTWLLDEKMKFEIWDNLGNNYDYVPADNTCPVQRFQQSQSASTGDCSIWSLWYLELRLDNLEMDPFNLEKIAYNQLKQKNNLTNFIKAYGQNLLNINDQIRYLIKQKYNIVLQKIKLNDPKVLDILTQLIPMEYSLIRKLAGIRIN